MKDTLPTPHLGTSDAVSSTTPHLPAILPPAPPFLGTADAAAGTTPQLAAVPPCGEITDDSHKDSDVSIISTSTGHLSERSMSWQDWETSFMAFKAFFDGDAKIL